MHVITFCALKKKKLKKRRNNEKIHYENTPIQIYRKFHLQKLKNFS